MRKRLFLSVDTILYFRGGGGQWRINHPKTGVCYEFVLCDNKRWNYRVFCNDEYGKGTYRRLTDAAKAMCYATGRDDWRRRCNEP